ncbi:hypothetical protein [Sphingobacterium lactis]|uniref:hypothetical protein n=1 Tax=Sphingobacterium lactis TaxID=797291 RepID=UPI003DA20886
MYKSFSETILPSGKPTMQPQRGVTILAPDNCLQVYIHADESWFSKFCIFDKNETVMKTGDSVLIAPQVTGRAEWTEATIIEVEQNPYVGIVITAKAVDGEIFFEKEDMFRLLDSKICTQ